MNESAAADQSPRLLALYDRAVPQVYGYLVARVNDTAVAEDLTAETFLAAVRAVREHKVSDLTIAWLITVARNKLVDHWRRLAREERTLQLATDSEPDAIDDGLDERFDRQRTREVLGELGAHHRAALTLRYLDGLSVPEVAHELDRTVHATEALLVRARKAFRGATTKGGAMTDPFDALREPIVPLAPRPEFARELRRRIAAELTPDPEDHTMPVLAIREYTPARLHSLTPYLATSDPARAIAWYAEVFDAVLLGDPIVMPDGRIGHAEMRVGDTVFMLAGEFPEEGHMSPETLGGSSVGLMLHVPDSEATYNRAVDLGATALRPVAESYGARGGTIRDPFGHRWFVQTAIEADDVPVEDVYGRRYGDVGYITLMVGDGDRAARFFGSLFDWQIEDGHQTGSFHISSITPPAGISGGADNTEVRLYFRVDDIDAAAARVRDLGGDVLSITDYDSGGNAECVDDQGLRFDLFRPKPGY